MSIDKLDNEIKLVCPIHGISIGRKDDKSTWRIDFKDTATDKEKANAQAVIDAFDWSVEEVKEKDMEDKKKVKDKAREEAIEEGLQASTGLKATAYKNL